MSDIKTTAEIVLELRKEGRTHIPCIARMETLEADLAALRQRHAEALALVARQAEDDGLWFIAHTAPEIYLQQALRALHAALETVAERDNARKNISAICDAMHLTESECEDGARTHVERVVAEVGRLRVQSAQADEAVIAVGANIKRLLADLAALREAATTHCACVVSKEGDECLSECDEHEQVRERAEKAEADLAALQAEDVAIVGWAKALCHEYGLTVAAENEGWIGRCLRELTVLRQQPCGCACHSVAGHTDEPTVSMMLSDAVKGLVALRQRLEDAYSKDRGKTKEINVLVAENRTLRQRLEKAARFCYLEGWNDVAHERGADFNRAWAAWLASEAQAALERK